jgi:hypothetical protein
MGEDDPHIHVGANLNADAMSRNMIASTFGLVGDLPGIVTTGCGLRARRLHLSYAKQLDGVGGMPGIDVSREHARQAAQTHRELAEKFLDSDA